MDSQGFSGPLALTHDRAKIIRAGKRSIGVWNIDESPVRGGGEPHQTIRIDDELQKAEISKWIIHPSRPSSMICGFGKEYRCMQVDLGTGKVAGSWLGHGSSINQISTSSEDPNTFLTAAGDGLARLYDVRKPTPVFSAFGTGEHMYSSVLAHVGSQPCEFSHICPLSPDSCLQPPGYSFIMTSPH